jgi:hypothetical protein
MTEKINDIGFYYRVPPISRMTEQQLASWRNIAKMNGQIIYLLNGLDIHPSGSVRIDYKVSCIYDTEYAFHKFMHEMKKSKSFENSKI